MRKNTIQMLMLFIEKIQQSDQNLFILKSTPMHSKSRYFQGFVCEWNWLLGFWCPSYVKASQLYMTYIFTLKTEWYHSQENGKDNEKRNADKANRMLFLRGSPWLAPNPYNK